MDQKTPNSSVIQTRKIVSQEHLNPNHTLFGGYLMCWMDEVAFMCARRYSGVPTCVTVNIDNISFIEPIRLGEHIVLTACVNYVGRTSMEIGVKVQREDAVTNELKHTNSAYLTFVCLDKNFKPIPVPPLTLETEEDQRRYHEAHLRLKVRKRLKNHLENKLNNSNKIMERNFQLFKEKAPRSVVSKIQKSVIDFAFKFENLEIVERIKKIPSPLSFFK